MQVIKFYWRNGLLLAWAVLLSLYASSQVPGTLNFYFGNLHSHSSYSDGNADDVSKTPAHDYEFAKTALCMDFLGISEHNHTGAGMHLADWQPGRSQAAAATTAGFVGLYGMEWGVISAGGHVIVYGMDSLVGWEPGQYQVYVPRSAYTGPGGLFDILNRHGGNALAYMAHPNNDDYNNLYYGGYDLNADNAVVGTAVESGPAFSTNTSYNDPGNSMAYLGYYRNLLSKGYHVGPTIDHDNHNMTFGKTAKTRLVIMAPSLEENSLLDAMRQMRFYASQDCNARINFSINDDAMGSILTGQGAPVIMVSGITTAPVSSIKIMYGVPGSGAVATELAGSSAMPFSYTDNGLTNLSQRYYYLDITETDGSRIITAPIWYSRNDGPVSSSSITSFFAINEPTRVILKWTTLNEEPGEQFYLERSIDGGNSYTLIGQQAGRGTGTNTQAYALIDSLPFSGVARYRLQERLVSGASFTSEERIVDRSITPVTWFSIYPNPVRGILNVKIHSAREERTLIELYDMAGRKVAVQDIPPMIGEQNIPFNMGRLSAGTYIIRIKTGTELFTKLVNKL